jgi:molybdate transport system substrate-binding protein
MELYKIVSFVLALAVVGTFAQRPVRRDLLVAAAASLGVVAPELTHAFHEAGGIDLRFNFAGSNTLARQIVEGARVDVFVSADVTQMDLVERAGKIVAGTRTDFISNQLVVIASRPTTAHSIRADDLAAPSVRRVAMGDPQGVPAGVYGRQWLEHVRLWGVVQPKVVPLPSSPAVVAAVREGRADAGIVYLSDVTNRDSLVRVVHHVAIVDAPPIMYPVAAITGGRIPLAREFVVFLRSTRAQEIFAAAGFRPLGTR